MDDSHPSVNVNPYRINSEDSRLLSTCNEHSVTVIVVNIRLCKAKLLRSSISVLCLFKGRSKPQMTQFFSVASSILYMFIFLIIALHPVQHCSILSSARLLIPSILPSKTVRRTGHPSAPFSPTICKTSNQSISQNFSQSVTF